LNLSEAFKSNLEDGRGPVGGRGTQSIANKHKEKKIGWKQTK